jgi:outer membrane protein OmpA-like peptidoglycan-associated protein
LFATNKSDLTTTSKASLDKFAISLLQNPETDVTIFGHTDSTGSLEVNERISLQRAQSVQNYLQSKGVEAGRIIKVEGKAYNEPVASNDTAEGRAANRRVEVYISANENMVEQAEAGTLK